MPKKAEPPYGPAEGILTVEEFAMLRHAENAPTYKAGGSSIALNKGGSFRIYSSETAAVAVVLFAKLTPETEKEILPILGAARAAIPALGDAATPSP